MIQHGERVQESSGMCLRRYFFGEEARSVAPDLAKRPGDQTEAQGPQPRRMVCLDSGGARQRVAVPFVH